MTLNNIVHWKTKLDSEHLNITQNLFEFFIGTADKKLVWQDLYSQCSTTSLLSTSAASLRKHWWPFQTHLKQSISKDYTFPKRRPNCRTLVKHSERPGKSTIHVSQSRVNSIPLSSPQMLVPLPPTKTTKSLTDRQTESPGKRIVVLEITGVFENKVVAVEHPPSHYLFQDFQGSVQFTLPWNTAKNSPPPASHPEVNNILQLSLNKIQPILDQ